jgi:CHAD domain-containing protein
LSNQPGTGSQSAVRRPSGLSYWMDRVIEECDRALLDLNAESVHDLRIALRRCRTIADGFMVIDPDKSWKVMKKECGRIFKRLGELRDVQVMMGWIPQFGTYADPAAARMMNHLVRREQQLKLEAIESLRSFDRKAWSSWSKRLQKRSRLIPLEGRVFQLDALRAWEEAYQLHKEALRNRSDRSFHALRIGLKRLRYTVENFLPARHEQWGQDFKNLQDYLGEVHDLAVLWDTGIQIQAFPDTESRKRWRSRLHSEKQRRVERYREKTVGPDSLWSVWRAGLPPKERLRSVALLWLQKSAYLRGTDLKHARRVRSLALQLYRSLKTLRPASRGEDRDWRSILHAAAIFHEVGGAAMRKKHGRASARVLCRFPDLPGFPRELLLRTASIVRYHHHGLGILEAEHLAGIQDRQRQAMIMLAGILRIAEALVRYCHPPIAHISIPRDSECIIIEAEGYSESGRHVEKLARDRHLLEYASNRPVLIRRAGSANHSVRQDPI